MNEFILVIVDMPLLAAVRLHVSPQACGALLSQLAMM